MQHHNEYTLRLAILPKRLTDGTWVCCARYYHKQTRWGRTKSVVVGSSIHGIHTDHEYISLDQYMTRKLMGQL